MVTYSLPFQCKAESCSQVPVNRARVIGTWVPDQLLVPTETPALFANRKFVQLSDWNGLQLNQ